MTQTFTIKRGDTSPALRWELGDPETILAGVTVVFNMRRKRDGVLVVNRAAAEVVTDADMPTLGYAWTAGDTDQAGLYDAEFEITFADQSVETYPNSENIMVNVVQDLG